MLRSLKRAVLMHDSNTILFAEFRGVLSSRRATLVEEIRAKLAEAGAERVAPDAVTTTDGGDKALLDLASELDLAQVQRDVTELREVEAAQARLTGGSYGRCADCGEPIAIERLRAMPVASRCTACQEATEKRTGAASGARL